MADTKLMNRWLVVLGTMLIIPSARSGLTHGASTASHWRSCWPPGRA
ncbi:MAG: hypothetical protein MZV65_16145 [Chromatiales bacterium]|nr:hypothetical protein [Chromatiales bacterium]